MHGANDDLSHPVAHQIAVGRLGLLYRNWIIPGLERRFDEKHLNVMQDREIEGYHRTFFKVLRDEVKALHANMMFGFTGDDKYSEGNFKRWADFSDLEKENIRKGLADISFILMTGATIGMLNGQDDKKKTWASNFTMYQAERLQAELLFYSPPWTDTWKILQS